MKTRVRYLAVSGAVIVALMAADNLYFRNRIYPGVNIAGWAIGGRDINSAENTIRDRYTKSQEIAVEYKSMTWKIKSVDLNFRVDENKTVGVAFSVGRTGSGSARWSERISAVKRGWWVEPVISWDKDLLVAAAASISAQIDIPAQEPEILLTENQQVVVNPGENGLEVDQKLLEMRFKNAVISRINSITVPVVELRPKLTELQVQKIKGVAEKYVRKRVVLVKKGTEEKWEIPDKQIITWIDPRTGNWNEKLIQIWLEELATAVNKPAQNASFRFVAENRVEEFKPEADGEMIDVEKTKNEILATLREMTLGQDSYQVNLAVKVIEPEITVAEINNLGIRQLLGRGESWFSGSITNRIFNLKKASGHLSGIIVPPGETFSFNQELGEVSAETGYKQAYIIKEGKTILGDGGGVCQVSSTLFRAVLAAGLPVIERTAHAYRVHYYEEKYQVGFDATVFQPVPDFKFQNDTPAYILIQTVYDEKKKYLAFELYGTSDGRTAEISKSRIWEQTAPPPDLYIDDPNLPIGVVNQTEHAAWGAKAAFDYKVTLGEEVLQDRTFFSNYRPWGAVYIRGTKVQ
jgi:vancomycin resistance protein YoaR